MEKNQITYPKTFKLKEPIAINVINSLYCYDQVKFFVELIPDLIQKHCNSALASKDLNNVGWIIKTMINFIDSTEMTALLQKYRNSDCAQMKPDTPLIDSFDVANRSEILSDQMLDWLNSLPADQQRKMYPMSEMKEFFISEFFFNEFLKWLDLVVTDNNIIFVELLDAYYSWFPIRPR
ncbi:hypothetical protein SAMN06265348_109306 [Pedobacter westerhofensis]|uniref:Uncharacterized protein n=1 Tax=Pedobacter westerhofensis TaxID=425512 RepID=A0A521EYB5_9SPHI|nr:hypothetical protein [Pedobacter westerhofensis]SMO88885.1 hypothetical protein SAMN06265348_109306 [Pedobacter westerhofensis]